MEHLHGTIHFCQIAVGHHLRRLVADANLEPGRAPIDKLDGPFGLQRRDGGVDVVGNDISPVQEAGRHVLAVAGITFHHLVVRLKTRHGNLLDRVLLVRRFCRRDDGRVGDKREVDARIRDKIGLEFVEINVERAVKAEGSGDGRDHCRSIRASGMTTFE